MTRIPKFGGEKASSGRNWVRKKQALDRKTAGKCWNVAAKGQGEAGIGQERKQEKARTPQDCQNRALSLSLSLSLDMSFDVIAVPLCKS